MMKDEQSRMTLSVVIVNYHIADEIDECLASIGRIGLSIDVEILMVDNSTHPLQAEALKAIARKHAPLNARVIVNDANIGFGAACNVGAREAQGKYLCFLNPDTVLVQDVFSPMIRHLEADARCGIVSPRQHPQTRWGDYSCGLFPSIPMELFNIFLIGRTLEALWMNHLNQNGVRNVDWVMGAFLMMKRSVFIEVGMFDTRYFMYFEESDLCLKCKRSGYLVLYDPRYFLVHAGGAAGKKDYRFFTRQFFNSKLTFIDKWYAGADRWTIRALIYGQIILQSVVWSMLLPFRSGKAIGKLKGFHDILFSEGAK